MADLPQGIHYMGSAPGPGYGPKGFVAAGIATMMRRIHQPITPSEVALIRQATGKHAASETIVSKRFGTSSVIVRTNFPKVARNLESGLQAAFMYRFYLAARAGKRAALKRYNDTLKGVGNFGTPGDQTSIPDSISYEISTFGVSNGRVFFGFTQPTLKGWAQEFGLRAGV